MSDLAYGAASILGYTLMAAATAGYLRRRLGDKWANGDSPVFIVPAVWPAFWAGWLAWKLFIKPTIPLIVGVYRLSAGMTWSPPDEDE